MTREYVPLECLDMLPWIVPPSLPFHRADPWDYPEVRNERWSDNIYIYHTRKIAHRWSVFIKSCHIAALFSRRAGATLSNSHQSLLFRWLFFWRLLIRMTISRSPEWNKGGIASYNTNLLASIKDMSKSTTPSVVLGSSSIVASKLFKQKK